MVFKDHELKMAQWYSEEQNPTNKSEVGDGKVTRKNLVK